MTTTKKKKKPLFSPASEKQAMLLRSKANVIVAGGAAAGGKAQRLSSPVLTPSGWCKMGDLKVGDYIITPDGQSVPILQVHPQGVLPIYRVTTQDKSYTEVSGDHLWSFTKAGDGIRRKPTVMTTLETKDYLDNQRDKTRPRWPLIPLVKDTIVDQLEDTISDYPYPYTIGALLGDGCITGVSSVSFACEDKYVAKRMKSEGVTVTTHGDGNLRYGIIGFKDELIRLDILGTRSHTKFIPKELMNLDLASTYSIINGMMDTGGSATPDGKTYYYSTSDKLANGIAELIRKVGGTATITVKEEPKYTYKGETLVGKPYNIVYIRHPDPQKLFGLKRKKDRCHTRSLIKNRIMSIEPAGEAECQCITIDHPDHLYITDDYIVTHNSYMSQLMPLAVKDDPNSNIMVYRNTLKQIKLPGAIWDTARSIYNKLPKHLQPKYKNRDNEMEWPSGARQVFMYLDHIANSKENLQGSQITLAIVDEATQIAWELIRYIMSRLRSESVHESKLVLTCNPDPDHEIRKFIDWFIDDKGYPIKERQGVLRWFIPDPEGGGDFVWGNSRQELIDKWQEEGEDPLEPLSMTFVGFTIHDNPPVKKANPTYLPYLKGLPPTERARLLDGNWDIRDAASNYFDRKWLIELDKVPDGVRWCRAWDLASSERTESSPRPDFSACMKVGAFNDGDAILVGDYHDSVYDEKTETQGRFCKKPGARDRVMIRQAQHDGPDCKVVEPVDPGQAGQTLFNMHVRMFLAEGFSLVKDPAATNAGKLTKFTPFSSAAERGTVYIVRSTFDNNTYNKIMKELESFDGTRSSSERKDDYADAVASGYNYITSSKSKMKAFAMPTYSTPTMRGSR